MDVAPPRAGAVGTVRVAVENAGLATWIPQDGDRGVKASYHWLDPLGNALLWDGARTQLPHAVPPGGRAEIELNVRAPLPPGRYRLALDLVDELKRWFGEVGSHVPQIEVEVAPRVARRLAVVGADAGTLAAQDEPEALVTDVAEAEAVAHLAPGVEPAPDWVRRVLDAHQEGYGVVGGSVAAPAGLLRRQARALHAWAPGGGRNPLFAGPLLCASVAADVDAVQEEQVAGLPAYRAPAGEPWVYDGRITARLRSGRPPS